MALNSSRRGADRTRGFFAGGTADSNANLTVGGYYQLTPAVTLVLEAGQTRSDAFDGTTVKMNGASFGGIIFF